MIFDQQFGTITGHFYQCRPFSIGHFEIGHFDRSFVTNSNDKD